MMKARFSSSQSWTESLIHDGKLYRYSEGKVNKAWKEGFASLRDDSSFRWYKDPAYLVRKCELWIDEIAPQIRFGRGAIAAYGAPPKIIKSKRFPITVPSAYEELLMAFPVTKPGQKHAHIQWFLFTSDNQKKLWINAFSQALEGVACLPPTPKPAGFLHAQSAPTYRRAKSETYVNETMQTPWERYWIGFSSQKSVNERTHDDNENETPRVRSHTHSQGSPPSYTSQDTARIEGTSDVAGEPNNGTNLYSEGANSDNDGEITARNAGDPTNLLSPYGRDDLMTPSDSFNTDDDSPADSPSNSPAVPRVSA